MVSSRPCNSASPRECDHGGTLAQSHGPVKTLGERFLRQVGKDTDIDVLKENLGGVLWGDCCLGLLDLSINKAASSLVELLELILVKDSPVNDALSEAGDGIVAGAHALDFLPGLQK